jgi:hypothetical protein
VKVQIVVVKYLGVSEAIKIKFDMKIEFMKLLTTLEVFLINGRNTSIEISPHCCQFSF